MTGQDIMLRLWAVILLIALNAFFVTAEFSLVSVRRSRISQLVEAGDIQAQTVQSLQRSIDRLLSTTQLGITLASLALGWIGENTTAVLIKQLLIGFPFPFPLPASLSHTLALPIAFFFIAYLQIVLGELCPKSVALVYSEQVARFLGPPIGVISRIFNPFIWILNQSTRLLLRTIGLKDPLKGWSNQVTPEELQLIIATERESTGLEAEERELLSNIFEFSEVITEEAMIPRTQLVAIPETATFAELLQEVTTMGHSRYPIKGESLDDIRGMIDFKDLSIPMLAGELTPESPIRRWVKPVKFVTESMPLNELLSVMQRSHLKMAMVVDEFGGTSGLITLQDIIDEILGEQVNNKKTESFPLQIIDDQTFLVEAQIDVEVLNELLDLDIPLTDEYQTLSGFLLYQWQKIPQLNESLTANNCTFSVIEAEGPRLSQIKIQRYPLGTGNKEG